MRENRKAQEKLLGQFKEEMQIISSQWQNDAKGKSEKILNAALVSSKEAITKLLQHSAEESIYAMKTILLDEVAKAGNLINKEKSKNWFVLLVTLICFSMVFLIYIK